MRKNGPQRKILLSDRRRAWLKFKASSLLHEVRVQLTVNKVQLHEYKLIYQQ